MAMGWYVNFLKKAGQSRYFANVAKTLLPPVDRMLYKATSGAILSSGPHVLPTLLLTSVGKKSGEERMTPLLYIEVGDRLVVAGTNFGQRHHPAWSENLLAKPQARVQIRHRTKTCQARLATVEEKESVWPRLVEIWPAYDTYQHRSGRDIRVFILDPLP